jgi:hypothetical protein
MALSILSFGRDQGAIVATWRSSSVKTDADLVFSPNAAMMEENAPIM